MIIYTCDICGKKVDDLLNLVTIRKSLCPIQSLEHACHTCMEEIETTYSELRSIAIANVDKEMASRIANMIKRKHS